MVGSLILALNPIKVFGINTIGFWFWTLGVIILDGCYNATSVAWQYFQGFLLFWNLTFLHWWWPHKGRWHVPLHTGASAPPPTVIDLLRTSLLPPLCAPELWSTLCLFQLLLLKITLAFDHRFLATSSCALWKWSLTFKSRDLSGWSVKGLKPY